MPDFETRAADDAHASVSGGLLASARGLGDGLLESVRQRLELFALELREEKLRATQLLIWLSVAVFAAGLAVTFASLALVFLFWETARLAVLGGLALFYTAGCLIAVRKFRRWRAQHPKPFEATLAELQNDRACIRPRS